MTLLHESQPLTGWWDIFRFNATAQIVWSAHNNRATPIKLDQTSKIIKRRLTYLRHVPDLLEIFLFWRLVQLSESSSGFNVSKSFLNKLFCEFEFIVTSKSVS